MPAQVQTGSILGFVSQGLLVLVALVLSVINGLFLAWRYITDRPILRVKAVHPSVYQWFFRLPSREYRGTTTRSYGFLVYFDVVNRGRRAVQIESWRLRLRDNAGHLSTLDPLSIPEPRFRLGEAGEKRWPVFGVGGPTFPGTTLVPSGGVISGFAYYSAEWWGDPKHDLAVKDGIAEAVLEVRSVLGNRAQNQITLREITLERAMEMVDGIGIIHTTLTDQQETAG